MRQLFIYVALSVVTMCAFGEHIIHMKQLSIKEIKSEHHLCCVSGKNLWPFFFEKNTVTGQIYLEMLQNKTVTAVFHSNNREAKRELKVYDNDRLLPFCPNPTYLGIKLDRSLTFRHHQWNCAKNYPRASHC